MGAADPPPVPATASPPDRHGIVGGGASPRGTVSATARVWTQAGVTPSERWVTLERLKARIRIQEAGPGPTVPVLRRASQRGTGR